MEEKRKSARIRARLAVSFKARNTLLAAGARTKDVSETGVSISSKHHFPIDFLIELVLRSDDLKEPIKALARVVRVANRSDSKFPFEVGLVFLDLSVANRNILYDYIRRSMPQGKNKDVNWPD